MKRKTNDLIKVHGRGKCHICGMPKAEPGKGICSYPHAMLPVAPAVEGEPGGFWSWERPTDPSGE